MEAKKEPHPPILDQLQEYAETRLKLAKYRAIEGGSSIFASMVADVVVIICMVLAFIFASITLGFYLGYLFNQNWMGFGCVALVYLIIALVVKYNRKSIERPIINTIIQKIFK
jgi:hypothetical protein